MKNQIKIMPNNNNNNNNRKGSSILSTIRPLTNMTDAHEPMVVCRDWLGLWSSLPSLYWSTSSNTLVSRDARTIITEIVSHYCPQCCTKYVVSEAMDLVENGGLRNRCATCLACPLCSCVIVPPPSSSSSSTSSSASANANTNNAAVTSDDENISLRCGYCGWVGLMDKNNNKEKLRFANNDFKQIVSDYNKTINQFTTNTSSSKNNNNNNNNNSETHLSQTSIINSEEPNTYANRVCLLTKKTVRSRLDIDNNRMNILVQPKPLPLEGDSSLNTTASTATATAVTAASRKGKWWVKDASAIHFAPSIFISDFPTFNNNNNNSDWLGRIELRITNPRDTAMTIVVQAISNNNNSNNNSDMAAEGKENVSLLWLSTQSNSNNSNSSAGKDGAMVVLEAHEDELLRAVSEDDDNNNNTNNNKLNSNNNNDSDHWQWLSSVRHNSAQLSIPIRINNNNNNNNKKVVLALELRLHCFIGDEQSEAAAELFNNNSNNSSNNNSNNNSKDGSRFEMHTRVLLPFFPHN